MRVQLLSIVLLFLIAPFLLSVSGENILFFHSTGTSSHRTAIWPLAEQLVERGHNVTYIFPLTKRVGSHPKIEEIIPSKVVPILMEWIGDFDINIRLNGTINEFYSKSFQKSFELCKAFYESPEIQEWMSRPNLHYDLVIIDASLGECIYGLVHKFRAKHIIFGPVLVPFMYDGFGFLPETSSIPSVIGFNTKPTEMSFFNRLKTTLAPLLWRMGYVDFCNKVESLLRNKLNFTDMPSIREMEMQTSLIFLNYHIVEDYALSLPPMIIPFSGLWCSKAMRKEPKQLPENLKNFIGNNDFIYVSFGSAVLASTMPTELRNQFLNAFAAFPNTKFLWRWTGPKPNNAPVNVFFDKWFPQHDILAHPKIKGFITQAGRPSTQEALCNAVPMISMPIMGDQDYNADKLEYIGGTIKLEIETVTAEKLIESIKELTETDKYSNRMKELSVLFKDRPIDSLDNVIYWTEYALRHNTSLLKSQGINQTWWQRRLIDVYAFLFTVVIFTFGILILAGYYIFKSLIVFLVAPNKKKTE